MNNNSEKKPLVSIITASLNSEETIERTIQSVLNQTYSNIEYIVIDGKSQDETVNIIKRYENKIAYFISEKDNGISDGFNKGIKKASGEIVGILNADDWYEEDTIESIVKLDRENNKDFYVGAIRYWENEKDSFVVLADKDFYKKIFYKMPQFNHPSSFFKKKVYDDVGLFNLKLRYAMDYDFLLRAIQAGKTFCISNNIFTNMQLGGVSDVGALASYKEVFRIAPNKLRSSLWFLLAISKFFLRNSLSSLGLQKIVKIVRRFKYDGK